MECYIILSAGGGLLESKPFQSGRNFPPYWQVFQPIPLELPRFVESADFLPETPLITNVLRFRRTDTWRAVQAGITACIYELELGPIP